MTTHVPDARLAESQSLGRRDLVIAVTTLVVLSRLVDGPPVWVIAALLLAATLLGTLQVLGDAMPAEGGGVPIESLLTPSVAAVGSLAAIRLVPAGLWLVPAAALAAWLVDRALRTEGALATATHGPTPAERTVVLVEAVVVAFVAFTGAAALVPHGLAEPGAAGTAGASPLSETELLLLVALDGLVAALLGYRTAALRVTTFRAALWSALTSAAAVAIGAAALRAMAIPRLVGPALLALVFFLWDAFHGAPAARRRDARWIWQTVLLAILGLVVAVWNLGLR